MFQKRTQTVPRLLTPDDPDAPAAFFVFESEDLYDALDAARDAFANAATRLVVWHNPPFFGTPMSEIVGEDVALRNKVQEHSMAVSASFQVKTKFKDGWRGFFDPGYDYLEIGVREHFYDISQGARQSSADYSLWHDDTLDLAEALEDCFSTDKIKLTTKFQTAARQDFLGAHMPSYLRSNSLRAIRMINGNSLRFYDEADVARRAYHKGLRTVSVKDNAQAWAVQPWDIAFISQNVVCENPVASSSDAPHRVMQIFDMKSRNEFVASAQRPTFRPIIRPWLRRMMNGPDDL